ncbi:MAG: RNA-binding S4 domain-containing protein [Candidatus Nanopelagicales bacterium]|jgi:ribosome-associated protein
MTSPQDVPVGPDGIRLGQLLKYVDAVATGGEVKGLLESGEVTVNGRVVVQRGAQLQRGDVVAAHGRSWRLT